MRVKFSKKHASYKKRPMIELKSEITFQPNGENLTLKQGVFRWVTNIHEHKRYYYTFDNSLHYLLRAFRTLHKSFHAKS